MTHSRAFFRALMALVVALAAIQTRAAEDDRQPPRERPNRPDRPDRAQGNRPRENNLKPGDLAPDFELPFLTAQEAKSADDKSKAKKDDKSDDRKMPDSTKKDEPQTLKLSSLRGKKPVLLIFGSYT